MSSDQLIFFGGSNGYNRFNPLSIPTSQPAPSTVLTEVRFPQTDVSIGMRDLDRSVVELSHNDKVVTFVYGLSTSIHPRTHKYKSYLEGFDKSWSKASSDNSSTYMNLSPGNYRFNVKGSDSSGVWDSKGASINLRVLPAPWQTLEAYLLYACIFSLALWATYRVFYSYVIDRKATALAQEMYEAEERAEDDRQEMKEYQDELIQAAFAHKQEILLLIEDYFSADQNKREEPSFPLGANAAASCLTALRILEDHTYYRPEGPVANLHTFANAAIDKLLRSEDANPETTITINEIPDDFTPSDVASPMAIIFYELAQNAFQHAFPADSPVNYLRFNFLSGKRGDTPEYYYRLTVSDSGTGSADTFPEDYAPGSGLAAIQAIVQRLGGSMEITFQSGVNVNIELPSPE